MNIGKICKLTFFLVFGAILFSGPDLVDATSSFTITAPTAYTVVNGEETAIEGLSIGGDTGNVPVQLRVTTGTLEITETTGLVLSTGTSGSLLEFSGDVDDVNNALATLTYTRGSTGSETLEISLVESGEVFFEDNGHIYEYVSYTGTWDQAKAQAEARTKYGAPGYLVTIGSEAENDYVATRLEDAGWMGANDKGSEGNWFWNNQPAGADDESNGVQFWAGDGSGATVGGRYANWNTGEPNDSGGNEDCGQFLSGGSGLWNDLPCSSTTLPGYVVEYSSNSGSIVSGDSFTIATVNDPDINSPSASTITDELAFDLDVNAAGQAGSFRLIFEIDDEVVNTLTLDDLTAGNHTFTVNHEDVTDISQVSSATSSTLDEAIYDVIFRYTSSDGSATLEQEVTGVAFDLEIPTVVNFTPGDNSTTRNPDNFTINFSEAVQSGGTGLFKIYRISDDGLIYGASFAAVDIQGSGTSTLTFDTGADFRSGLEYYIQFNDGFFEDMRGRQVTGYNDNSTDWNFTYRRSSSSEPAPIDYDQVSVDLGSADSGAEFVCRGDEVDVEVNFSYDGAKYYAMNTSDDFTSLSWKNYQYPGASEVMTFSVDSVPESVFVRFQNFDLLQGLVEVDLSGVNCENEFLEEVEEVEDEVVQEDEVEEEVDYSGLEPTFSEYYGVWWAPDSGLTGLSPWNGLTERIDAVAPGWYIRGRSYDTVYLVTEDMKRRPFMNAQTFLTYADWGNVIWVQDATLQTLPMAPMIVPKAEVVLVKLESKSDVYFVEAGEVPVLRRLAGEGVAVELFGEDWSDYVLDISPSMFRSYEMGEEVLGAGDLPGFDASRMVKRGELE